MNNVTIITNNVPRKLVSFYDIPESARGDFDYVKEDGYYTSRFVRFKDAWYDVFDTQGIRVRKGATFSRMGWDMVVSEDSPFVKWNAIVSESFFSGVLFRFVDDDHVVVGRYIS